VRGASDDLNIALNAKMEGQQVCNCRHFVSLHFLTVQSVEARRSLFKTNYAESLEGRICCDLQQNNYDDRRHNLGARRFVEA